MSSSWKSALRARMRENCERKLRQYRKNLQETENESVQAKLRNLIVQNEMIIHRIDTGYYDKVDTS